MSDFLKFYSSTLDHYREIETIEDWQLPTRPVTVRLTDDQVELADGLARISGLTRQDLLHNMIHNCIQEAFDYYLKTTDSSKVTAEKHSAEWVALMTQELKFPYGVPSESKESKK